MSSRALRKLQREQEEQKQLAQLAAEEETRSGSESESKDAPTAPMPIRNNAFDFLDEAGVENQSDDGEMDSEHDQSNAQHQRDDIDIKPDNSGNATPQRRNKKKGKKRKKASKTKETTKQQDAPALDQDKALDEIDQALKELKTKGANTQQDSEDAVLQEDMRMFYNLLSTDSKHLNSLNEMKRLFGSTVLDGESDGPNSTRRRGRGPQQLDLAAALSARHNPISRGVGLSGLALRKNALIPGKEEWPKAPSGGLVMEIVEKAWDFTTEYRFKHNSEYQRVQKDFEICVESMDPQRMITLLRYNPYHISTLLQVSEIAKHQGDHSVSAELLERALFNFGRSAQSTFQNSLNEGKARLDFRRPENRELWLTAWRYIVSLGQRGTWRTAYEWAKLLLSLDPEGDPYRIRLIIDQLAIRGGQFENFISLTTIKTSTIDWGQDLPNIQISLAMAHYRLKHAQESRRILSECIKLYPWIFERLFRELNLERLPKSIWGKQPRTSMEELQTASYALRAKDIWNTPEAVAFLVEVAETVKGDPSYEDPKDEEITRNDARHVLLADVPPLISYLPRQFTNERTSSSDPLPPEDDLPSYGSAAEEFDESFEREFGPESGNRSREQNDGQSEEQELRGLQSWFQNIISRLGIQARWAENGDNEGDPEREVDAEELARAFEESGVNMRDIEERTNRIGQLREMNMNRQAELGEEMQRREDELIAAALEQSQRDIEMSRQQGQQIPDTGAGSANPSEQRETSTSSPSVEAVSSSTPAAAPYDDQANQRWLAGRGMLALKDFIAKHGSDENVWKTDLEVDSRPATEYAFRILQLRQRSSRDFILNYSLPQGAGKEAGELIKRMVA